ERALIRRRQSTTTPAAVWQRAGGYTGRPNYRFDPAGTRRQAWQSRAGERRPWRSGPASATARRIADTSLHNRTGLVVRRNETRRARAELSRACLATPCLLSWPSVLPVAAYWSFV